MIRYALVCEDGHAFDAWFRDSDAFDVQNERGHVECVFCRSHLVRKAVMAPAVRRGGAPRAPKPDMPEGTPNAVAIPPASPAVMDDERFQAVRTMLRDLHAKLKENAENVGREFPAEARKIHDEEAPARPIYGIATPEEARALVEDGIDVLPLPALPDGRD